MSELAFVTGFPGFLATRLVTELCGRDPELRVVAIVESRMVEQANAAAARIDAARVDVVCGDIGERRLGLSTEVYDRLVSEMTVAYHLAAIYNLAVPLAIAQRVNVDGTGNVLELCRAAERLQRHNYVSTAYVAGDRTGVVYEHELVFGQHHKNHYESTKFQAEVWVRESMGDVPTTIYRPAIVVGDSKTGETQKFDGPYYILKLLALMEQRGSPAPQLGAEGVPFNVVPVDFVIAALLAGAAEQSAVGQTLHLVDPEPVMAPDLVRMLASELGTRQPSLPVPPKLLDLSMRSATVRRLFADVPRESLIYLIHDVRYDARRATELLARQDVGCPRFADYVAPMVAFFREHEHDPAFGGGGF